MSTKWTRVYSTSSVDWEPPIRMSWWRCCKNCSQVETWTSTRHRFISTWTTGENLFVFFHDHLEHNLSTRDLTPTSVCPSKQKQSTAFPMNNFVSFNHDCTYFIVNKWVSFCLPFFLPVNFIEFHHNKKWLSITLRHHL